MPFVISVGNNKGGTGKTTTSINLAHGLVLSEGQSPKVLLIDADEQSGTVCVWCDVREGAPPPFQVVAMRSPTIQRELPPLLDKTQFEYVIIDCPPGGVAQGSRMTRSAMWASDLLIMPAAPSGPDFWASDPVKQLLAQARDKGKNIQAPLLINRKAVNTRMGKNARPIAAGIVELPLFFTEIGQRAAIAEAITRGLTVSIWEGSSPRL
jgi:chromosome partitioning protein